MGWTSRAEWKSSTDAIADESTPAEGYRIAWHRGVHFIYVDNATGRPAPTTFLVRRDNGEVWVKDIGEISGKAMATKYIALATEYLKRNPTDKYVCMHVDEATKVLAECAEVDKVNNLKQGDRVYVRDEYVISGWATVVGWANGRRSLLLDFPNHPNFVKCPKRGVDVSKSGL